MTLLFMGPGGSFEERWMTYALLRDNVLHHVERGARGTRFHALYAVAGALEGNPVSVPARDLAAEIALGLELAGALPRAEFAVSGRTRAALQPGFDPVDPWATALARDAGIELGMIPAHAERLADVCGGFAEAVRRIAGGGADGAVVTVRDV